MALTTAPLTGTGRTWSIPNTTDTFAGLDSIQTLTNKTFNSIKINPSGVTSSQGDIFYTPTTGANLSSLTIGTAGSILSVLNGVPVWETASIKTTTAGPTLSTSQTANTIIKSIIIPANTIRSGDIPTFDVRGRKVGTATSNTVRVYLNTALSLSGATLVASYANAATMLYYQLSRTIRVIGTSASQVYQAAGTGVTTDTTNHTITTTDITNDWSVLQYLIVAHQHTAASDSSNVDFVRLTNL